MAYPLTTNFTLTNKNSRPIVRGIESNVLSNKLFKYSLSKMGMQEDDTGIMSLRLFLRDSGEFFPLIGKGNDHAFEPLPKTRG